MSPVFSKKNVWNLRTPPLPWTIKNSWYQIGSEVKEIKKVQKSKETRCQTSQEVEDVKTEVEPSARARYSSPLQWSIVTENGWLVG